MKRSPARGPAGDSPDGLPDIRESGLSCSVSEDMKESLSNESNRSSEENEFLGKATNCCTSEPDSPMVEPETAAEEMNEEQRAEQENSPAASEPIDRSTAMETLQLLKEYKKREFLYVSQICFLQKQLYMLESSPYELSSRNYQDVFSQSQTALLDPAVNLEIKELRLKLFDKGVELQKTKDELKASTFSAESVMGRRLINKCKVLQEENKDIGAMLEEHKLQPLQVQTNILLKQLAFFKQQLKTLHELNSDIDEENGRLITQLQELTVQYKRLQTEKEELVKKVSIYEQEESKQGSLLRKGSPGVVQRVFSSESAKEEAESKRDIPPPSYRSHRSSKPKKSSDAFKGENVLSQSKEGSPARKRAQGIDVRSSSRIKDNEEEASRRAIQRESRNQSIKPGSRKDEKGSKRTSRRGNSHEDTSYRSDYYPHRSASKGKRGRSDSR